MHNRIEWEAHKGRSLSLVIISGIDRSVPEFLGCPVDPLRHMQHPKPHHVKGERSEQPDVEFR